MKKGIIKKISAKLKKNVKPNNTRPKSAVSVKTKTKTKTKNIQQALKQKKNIKNIKNIKKPVIVPKKILSKNVVLKTAVSKKSSTIKNNVKNTIKKLDKKPLQKLAVIKNTQNTQNAKDKNNKNIKNTKNLKSIKSAKTIKSVKKSPKALEKMKSLKSQLVSTSNKKVNKNKIKPKKLIVNASSKTHKKVMPSPKIKPMNKLSKLKSAKKSAIKGASSHQSPPNIKNDRNATKHEKFPRLKKSKDVKNKPTVIKIKKEEKMKFKQEAMSQELQKHFREILLNWKKQLQIEMERTVHHLQDDAANFADPNDRATHEEEFNLELRTRDRERKLIKKIDEALQRLDVQDYGYCEKCGINIDVKRLEARPTATMCVDCKQLEEIREKHFN